MNILKTIVIASRNEGKIKEIKNFLHGLDVELLTLSDFPDMPAIVEDGKTFEENAMKKAKTVFEHSKLTTIADDSGLEVKYIGGEPGVNSARFAGDNATDQQNNEKLLGLLKDIPMDDRKARFKCVLVLYNSLYNNLVFEGKCNGYIIDEPKGELGFGYDPLFVPEGFNKTFGELDLVTKNKISHRGKALNSLRLYLEKVPVG
jgi:XTP/dITP diphosphohydrolase